MKYTKLQAQQILTEIERLNYEGNEWEQEFIQNIEGKDLTEKQSTCLDKIYEKATGGGMYERKEYFRR